MNTAVTHTQLKLINNDAATMAEVAHLAQSAGVAVVERGGEFAYCDTHHIPTGWKRFTIHDKAAA